MSKKQIFTSLASAFALTAVALGAFGAHALKLKLETLDTRQTWETAVNYHMWHALAILLVVALKHKSRLADAACASFTIGILLFSGSLYWLSLEGPKWLGPITPLGGLSLMAGWTLLLIAGLKSRDE